MCSEPRIGIPRDERYLRIIRVLSVPPPERIDYGGEMVGAPDAWAESRGRGILAGIADTGVALHSDLNEGLVFTSWADSFGSPTDHNGHGTHVAGLVGARQDGRGVIGIAPDCGLACAKVLADDGEGRDGWIAHGIGKLTESGAHIVNLSLGAPAEFADDFPQTRAAIEAGYRHGVVFVAAAGNDAAGRLDFPASMAEVISIGAIGRDERLTDFSNRGFEFVAPGDRRRSTWLGNTWIEVSGTSQAAPTITGLVALMLSHHWISGRHHHTPIPTGGPETTEAVRRHLRGMSRFLGADGILLPVWGHEADGALRRPPLPASGWFGRLFGRLFGWMR